MVETRRVGEVVDEPIVHGTGDRAEQRRVVHVVRGVGNAPVPSSRHDHCEATVSKTVALLHLRCAVRTESLPVTFRGPVNDINSSSEDASLDATHQFARRAVQPVV